MRDEGGGKGVSSLAPSPQARETWSKVLSVTERGLKAQLCLLGMTAVLYIIIQAWASHMG